MFLLVNKYKMIGILLHVVHGQVQKSEQKRIIAKETNRFHNHSTLDSNYKLINLHDSWPFCFGKAKKLLENRFTRQRYPEFFNELTYDFQRSNFSYVLSKPILRLWLRSPENFVIQTTRPLEFSKSFRPNCRPELSGNPTVSDKTNKLKTT